MSICIKRPLSTALPSFVEPVLIFKKRPSDRSSLSVTILCFLGELTNAISLPLDKPFYLYSMSGTRCQQVKGATVKEEAVIFDKNAGRYQINTEGDNPFQMVKNGAQMKLTYCYYTPGKETHCNLMHFGYLFFSIIPLKLYESFAMLHTVQEIVNRGEGLGNSTKLFVVCYCSLFDLDGSQNLIAVYSVLRI